MNPVHIYIIACVSMVGLWFVFGSFWKGLCYTVFAIGALAFWWAVVMALHALVS